MENLELIILLILLAVLVLSHVWYLIKSRMTDDVVYGDQISSAPEEGNEQPANYQIYEIANQLDSFFNIVAHPEELETFPVFEDGVRLLSSPEYSPDEIIRYAVGDHVPVSCMALQAMRKRTDMTSKRQDIVFGIGTFAPYQHYFALRFLARVTPKDEPLIGKVLGNLTQYMGHRLSRSDLETFIRQRKTMNEPLEIDEDNIRFLNEDGRAALRRFLSEIDPELGNPLLEYLDNAEHLPASQTPDLSPYAVGDADILETTGRVWVKNDAKRAKSLLVHEDAETTVAEIKALLVARQPQSVLLTGESGVGKTTIQRLLARQLFEEKWTIFVAGHSDLLAGQTFIGQLEQRLKQLIEKLRSTKKVIWHIPNIDRLTFTGTHQHSSFSVLDAILPYIADGSLRIIADALPSAYDRLVQIQPRIPNVMTVYSVDAVSRDTTLDIVRHWLKVSHLEADEMLLPETWDLAQQYLGGRAAPGNVMDLLKSTFLRLAGNAPAKKAVIGLDDVILTLSQQTGLPLDLLDAKRALDLDDLENSLSSRVIGQDEAVQCLVDRVAMIKAGISDPTRPFGVFLFAGPTGTGKTEIAKSLATWLFGSVDRLIRVDMSELQTPESMARLVGSLDNAENDSLADQVRKQPFSVVLLDEFEKAHPNVWDLFLQVFDDARITDRRGNTTSFRHTIIIVTVNLGATIPTGQSIGFSPGDRQFDVDEVNRAVETAFRREFINRLDRVVVFNPLNREQMRMILQRELQQSLNRRGLKGRPWAIEWDESAITFLLEKGFTPDLGARPLRRAIEQHLLSPLAATIVRHQFPEGDQFLFISCSGNSLQVEFVDPDLEGEDEVLPAATNSSGTVSSGIDVARSILLQPTGALPELASLQSLLKEVEADIGSELWRHKKRGLFTGMEQSEFWSSPERFSVLGLLETIDRVEKGVERALALQTRLEGHRSKEILPRRLITILSQSVYLLSVACKDVLQDCPREAFLLVEALVEGGPDRAGAVSFGHQIADMYEAWAKNRNMRLTRVSRTDIRNDIGMRALYCVSGYGAYTILARETGQHIKEHPGNTAKERKRNRVRVTVAPQPDAPLPSSISAVTGLAEKTLAAVKAREPEIVRRYCDEPSPLVRDAPGGWRTGRIDLVLGGNFDLF